MIARAYRDAGFEVIYTGLHQRPEQIVTAAVQEDADVVALSILSGAHKVLIPEVLDGLRREGLDDVLVLVGGIIPDGDADFLKSRGVSGVFGPGADTDEIIEFTRQNLRRQ